MRIHYQFTKSQCKKGARYVNIDWYRYFTLVLMSFSTKNKILVPIANKSSIGTYDQDRFSTTESVVVYIGSLNWSLAKTK